MLARLFALCLLLPCFTLHAQTIVCFGDSLTAGYGAPAGASYPDDLRKTLAQAGSPAVVLNQGISGNTTKDGLARIDAVLRLHPAIVVLEFGANDGLRGFPVPDIQANLVRLIEQLGRAHVRILLLGIKLPPNLGADYTGPFDAMYPALAAKYKLPLVPFLLEGVYDRTELMSQDYIHPSAAGYVRVAQNIYPYLQRMLAK